MALKTTIKQKKREEKGFFKGFFLREENYQNLMHYSERTKKKDFEIINDLLENFFANRI